MKHNLKTLLAVGALAAFSTVAQAQEAPEASAAAASSAGDNNLKAVSNFFGKLKSGASDVIDAAKEKAPSLQEATGAVVNGVKKGDLTGAVTNAAKKPAIAGATEAANQVVGNGSKSDKAKPKADTAEATEGAASTPTPSLKDAAKLGLDLFNKFKK